MESELARRLGVRPLTASCLTRHLHVYVRAVSQDDALPSFPFPVSRSPIPDPRSPIPDPRSAFPYCLLTVYGRSAC